MRERETGTNTVRERDGAIAVRERETRMNSGEIESGGDNERTVRVTRERAMSKRETQKGHVREMNEKLVLLT